MTKLPSLGALRAFESAARNQSFARAAIELSLSPTAISHRIRDLEDQLSVRLFDRSQGTITLTADGRSYLQATRPALMQIATATETATKKRDTSLTVLCLVGFALDVLIPALGGFCTRFPDCELSIVPMLPDAVAPHATNFDVAIWHGAEPWEGLDADRLLDETIFPVGVPELTRNQSLACWEDFDRHTIIRNVSPLAKDEWQAWMDEAGLGQREFSREIFCSGLSISLNAVRAGLGIGLARSSLVKRDLAQGRLTKVFDHEIRSASAYFLMSRPQDRRRECVAAFRDWLLAVVAEGHQPIRA